VKDGRRPVTLENTKHSTSKVKSFIKDDIVNPTTPSDLPTATEEIPVIVISHLEGLRPSNLTHFSVTKLDSDPLSNNTRHVLYPPKLSITLTIAVDSRTVREDNPVVRDVVSP
jgi:hypothetical protein